MLAAFIDVLERIGVFIELAIPLIAVASSYHATTSVVYGQAPQPFWTYTKVFFLLLIVWWLLLQGLNLCIRLLQFLSSGRADPADLVYNANKGSPEIRDLEDKGRSESEVRRDIAEEIRATRSFGRLFSAVYFGLLYLVGLSVLATIT